MPFNNSLVEYSPTHNATIRFNEILNKPGPSHSPFSDAYNLWALSRSDSRYWCRERGCSLGNCSIARLDQEATTQ